MNWQTVNQAVELVKVALCGDKDLPVRVEAAIAIQMLISEQEKAKAYIQPFVKPVILELLNVIRETENDELTGVMQKLVCTYVEDVTPIAVDMMTHLAQTFAQIIESDSDGSEEKAISALGILNTMETILSVMEDQKEIVIQLEGIVLSVIGIILQNNIIDFYEEVLSLIYSLTSSQVSHHMWEVFGMIYQMFQKDGVDYFTDMMPALHNYITVDTAAFLANSQRPVAMYNMCRHILLEYDAGEDPECHAAKLLEVMILQCRDQVNQMIPAFLETVFVRLSREVKTSELRTMCLQVAIASLIHDNGVFYAAVESRVAPALSQDPVSVIKNFVGLWISDSDCFIGIHDRKLSVLGLCRLITLVPPGATGGSTPWQEYVPQIMPSLIMLFKGLKTAYECRKEAEEDEDSSDDEDEEDDDSDLEGDEAGALDSDEDEIDEDSAMYLESLQDKINKHTNGTGITATIGDDDEDDDSDEDDCDIFDETSLENYTTPLDDEDNGGMDG